MTRTRAMDERESRERYAHSLAIATVRRFPCSAQPDEEELLSVALLAAAEALARYDPDRGASFRSFALSWIRGSIQHAIRDWRPWTVGEQQRFRERGEVIPQRLFPLQERLAVDADPARRLSAWGWQWAIAELPEREARAVRLLHYERRSQDEIAAAIGLSQNGVSQLLRRAHNKLRKLAVAAGLAPEGYVAPEETQEARRSTKAQQQAPVAGRAEAIAG